MAFGYRRFGFKKSYRGKFSTTRRGSRFGRKGAWYNKNGSAAKQMAGFQNTQVTYVVPVSMTSAALVGGLGGNYTISDVGRQISLSQMHIAMSNVYDQFRIRKVVLKVTPNSAPFVSGAENSNLYYNLFSVLDRNGFKDEISIAELQTYQSYKQTAYAGTTSNAVRPHYHTYYNSSLFQKSRWYSTKKVPEEAKMAVGIWGGGGLVNKVCTFQFEWTFDVTYRGLRSNTADIENVIGQPE